MRILCADLDREWRGGQSQILLTVRGLRNLGHDAALLSVKDSPLACRAQAAGIRVHHAGKKARRAGAAFLLRKLLSRQHFDVLHINEPHALTAAWLAGAKDKAPVVVSRRVAYPIPRSGLARKRYQIAQRIIAISHFVEQSLLESAVPPESLSVVYEGVDLPALPTPEERGRGRQRWGVSNEREKLLGCVGYLLPEKGQEIAIRALSIARKEFPGARLLLAGDGPCRPALEALVRELGLQEAVIFAGFVAEISQVYAALDLFLFPSLAEPLGTSLLAAMAWGLPVVATAKGGVPEYVKDGENGLLAQKPDAELFSEGLAKLLGEESLRRSLGQNARCTIAEQFSAERMVANTTLVYEQVMKRGSKS